jgi:hypothetical protein
LFWLNVCVQANAIVWSAAVSNAAAPVGSSDRTEPRMLSDLYQQYRIGQLDKKLDRVQNTTTESGGAINGEDRSMG